MMQEIARVMTLSRGEQMGCGVGVKEPGGKEAAGCGV